MMAYDIKTKHVSDFVRKLLEGDLFFNYDDTDLKKGSKRPVQYQDKIERWIEISQDPSKKDDGEFSKLTEDLFKHILFFRLAGVILEQK